MASRTLHSAVPEADLQPLAGGRLPPASRESHMATLRTDPVFHRVHGEFIDHQGQGGRKVGGQLAETASELRADLPSVAGHLHGEPELAPQQGVHVHLLVQAPGQRLVDQGDGVHPAHGLLQALLRLL
ncbi:hypothetical protein ACFFX0_07030 [Citricoccus parietis]|uniref:Uncharacterized protein n=1 Tax=Citricoccus parietis TaxID=592307 RepID=A0ABV5FW96_9MICC